MYNPFKTPENLNIIERQRRSVYLYGTWGYLFGIALNMLLSAGPQSLFFTVINSIHAGVIISVLLLYIRQLLSLKAAVVLLILSIQIEIPIEMIHMAHSDGPVMGAEGVLGNMVLLSMTLILSIGAYVRFLPYVQTVITFVTYIICRQVTGDQHLGEMLPVFLLAFTIFSYMGDTLIRSAASLQSSNDDIIDEQNKVMEFLNIDKSELFRLMQLLKRKKLSGKQTIELLDMLGHGVRDEVLTKAVGMVEDKNRDFALLSSRIPELTPSEKDICMLILQGKSTPEIAKLLKKKIPTVASTRSHIRAKLEMSKDENLRDALIRYARSDATSPTDQ